MTPLLHLAVKCTGIRVKAGINGVVVAQDRRGTGYSTRSPLNEWIRPTGNRLEIDAWLPNPPATDAPPEFGVAIVFPEDEETPLEKERPPIVAFSWRAAHFEEFTPFRISLPFILPVACPTKLWTDAEVIDTWDDAAKAGAMAAAKEAYDAFAAKDVDRILESFAYRIEDNARAWLDDPAADKEGAREAYTALMKPETYELLPFEKVELNLIGDKRLVHVTREGAKQLIGVVPKPGSGAAALDVYVARIGGKWRVVR